MPAQVNGPDSRDRYHDRRSHPNSGVSLNNNAAFTGLLAALKEQPADHWNQCNARPKYFWQPSASAVSMTLHDRLALPADPVSGTAALFMRLTLQDCPAFLP